MNPPLTARRPAALVVAVDAFLDRFRDDPGTRTTYTETLRRLSKTAGDQVPVLTRRRATFRCTRPRIRRSSWGSGTAT